MDCIAKPITVKLNHSEIIDLVEEFYATKGKFKVYAIYAAAVNADETNPGACVKEWADEYSALASTMMFIHRQRDRLSDFIIEKITDITGTRTTEPMDIIMEQSSGNVVIRIGDKVTILMPYTQPMQIVSLHLTLNRVRIDRW